MFKKVQLIFIVLVYAIGILFVTGTTIFYLFQNPGDNNIATTGRITHSYYNDGDRISVITFTDIEGNTHTFTDTTSYPFPTNIALYYDPQTLEATVPVQFPEALMLVIVGFLIIYLAHELSKK